MDRIDLEKLKALAQKAAVPRSEIFGVCLRFNPKTILALIAEIERLEKLNELWKHDYENLADSIGERMKDGKNGSVAADRSNFELYAEARRHAGRWDKEADWLAELAGANADCPHKNPVTICKAPKACRRCWREIAATAVSLGLSPREWREAAGKLEKE